MAINKVVDGTTVPANGVREEIAIARAQGKPVIPIGATGHVAREVWEECRARPGDFVGAAVIGDQLAALGEETTPIPTLVQAVVEALRRLDT